MEQYVQVTPVTLLSQVGALTPDLQLPAKAHGR